MEGLNWLLAVRFSGSGGAILADEMGLGKTAQAISFLVTLQGWKLEEEGGGALDAAAASLRARPSELRPPAPAPPPPPLLPQEGSISALGAAAAAASTLAERARLVQQCLAAANSEARAAAHAAAAAAVLSRGTKMRTSITAHGTAQTGFFPPHSKRARASDEAALVALSFPPPLAGRLEPGACAPPPCVSGLLYAGQRGGTHGPHLIVVPSSTLENWSRELARWGPLCE